MTAAARNVRPVNFVGPVADFIPDPQGDGQDPRVKKFLALLTSRKVWFHLIGLAAATGIVNAGEVEQAELVNAALTLATFASAAASIALEDGIRAISKAVGEAVAKAIIEGKIAVK